MPPTVRLLALALLVASFGMVACDGGDDSDEDGSETTTAAAGECADAERPPPKEVRFDQPGRVLDPGEPATAVVETSCGNFEIELDTRRSPKTANSFAFLAEHGFYDDTWFHGIAPDSLIQGGDPTGDGTGGPGYSVDEPPADDTAYLNGTVAMAKTTVEPPGRSGSQFFVVTAADAGLPAVYAVLGEVGKGMDVVETIGELGDPATEEPLEAVVIERIAIERG